MKLDYYSPELVNKPCRPVTVADHDYIEELIERMILFCISRDAVGLAAPQIGEYVQAAVIREPETGRIQVMINPQITGFVGRDLVDEEACLSLPPKTATAKVIRSETIHLESGTIEDPDKRVQTTHTGYEARVVQHEIDHLNPSGGIFFIQRVSGLQRSIVLKKYAVWRKRNGLSPI